MEVIRIDYFGLDYFGLDLIRLGKCVNCVFTTLLRDARIKRIVKCVYTLQTKPQISLVNKYTPMISFRRTADPLV